MVIYANFSHNIRIDLTRSNITNIFSKYLHDHIICQNVGIMIWWRYFTMDIITLPYYKCENKIINIILMNQFLITIPKPKSISLVVFLSYSSSSTKRDQKSTSFLCSSEWREMGKSMLLRVYYAALLFLLTEVSRWRKAPKW